MSNSSQLSYFSFFFPRFVYDMQMLKNEKRLDYSDMEIKSDAENSEDHESS